MNNGKIEFGVTTLGRVSFIIQDSFGAPVTATIDRDAWERMKSTIDNMLKKEDQNART